MPQHPGHSQLNAAAALYGATSADLASLGAFESDVYAFKLNGQGAVLKVMAPTHRSAPMVQAEVDWLLALGSAGVPVAAPLPAVSGRFVEELPGESDASVVVAYRRAPGALTRPPDWTPARLEAWGELLGRLQAHSRAYVAPGPRRPTLLQQTYLARAAEIAQGDERFVAAATKLLERARPLLDISGDAGLIHADLHHGNLLLAGEAWTAIDFDDCAYGSYAFDLTMPLYYALHAQREQAAEAVVAEFLPPFLRGFRRHAPPPGGGAEAVATCLKVRQAELYLALKLKLPASRLSEAMVYLTQELRERVVSGAPVVSADVLARHLD